MTIVCTGSIAYDYLMSFPGYFRDHILPERLESLSLSFLVDSMVRQRGGTAPNIAYTLALLGERPRLVATVGEDFEDYRQWLESRGIDTTFVRVVPGEYTASFFVNTDLANAQIASFYAGAMAYASQISLRELSEKPSLVVISPNDPAAMQRYIHECLEMELPYLYDPSQQIVRVSPDELREGVMGAASLFVNEYEHELLQKHTGLKLADILKAVKLLVVTRGEAGSVLYANGQVFNIPPVKPQRLADPTGVGDAFRGGFLKGFQMGFDWQTCGQLGSLAATYCLEQRGTQNHFYTIEEFIARYRSIFDDHGILDALLQHAA